MTSYLESVSVEVVGAPAKQPAENHLHIADQEQLDQVLSEMRRSAVCRAVRAFADATLSLLVYSITAPTGNSAAVIPFTTYLGGPAGSPFPKSVSLMQDNIKPRALSEFISQISKLPFESRPKLQFTVEQQDTGMRLLGYVASKIRAFRKYGADHRAIELKQQTADTDHLASFLLDGNLAACLNNGSIASNEVANALFLSESSRFFSHPVSESKKIQAVLSKLENRRVNADPKEKVQLTELIIKLTCDLAFFADNTPQEIRYITSLATENGDKLLIANCQRFANQSYGLSDAAFSLLESACKEFDTIAENSEQFLRWVGPKFASRQNRNTTAFFQPNVRIDPAAFYADYEEAKAVFPSYGNLGMLGNAAGCAYLFAQQYEEAFQVFRASQVHASLPIDALNIRVNTLIAQHMAGRTLPQNELFNLAKVLADFDFGPKKEYQRVRAGLNLMRLTSSNSDMYELFWNAIRNSDIVLYEKTNTFFGVEEELFKNRFSHYYDKGRIPGIFGLFYRENGFNVCMDKDWT